MDDATTGKVDAEVGEHVALLETLFRNAPVGLAFVDRDLRYVHVSDALAAIGGLSREQLIGKTVPEARPRLWPSVGPYFRRALAGETIVNCDVSGVVGPSSSVRHWLVSFYPVRHRGEITGIGVVVNDITERKLAEDALAVRNALYAMLSRTNQAVVRCRSSDELYRRLCEIAVETGRFRFAWVGVRDGDRVRMVASAGEDGGYMDTLVVSLDEHDPRAHGPTGTAFREGRPVVLNDFMASAATKPWHENARRVGFAASAAFPLIERGLVVAVLTLYATVPSFFTDDLVTTLSEVTPSVSFALDAFQLERERARDEAELRQRDRAIGAASQGIVITDPSQPGNPIVYANPGFERMTGYPIAEVLGKNCRFLQGKDTSPEAVATLKRYVASGSGGNVEILNYRKDGTSFWNDLTLSPVLDAAGALTHFVGVQTDVTDRKLIEQQYRQSQKLEAIGQLAGGIAHDFNNLLMIINGNVELVLSSGDESEASCELLSEVVAAGERAAALTQQLLAFTRKQVLAVEVVDLSAVVAHTERMLRRLLSEDIVLRTTLDADGVRVLADRGQLSQILINLAVNARDAMGTGGLLEIETHTLPASCDIEGWSRRPPGDVACLIVRDDGAGMDEATRARVFEPFFTTKRTGTGLGLATVAGIVRQARGHIEVESEPGRGTVVSMYLPSAGPGGLLPGASEPARVTRGGTETILLVEDDRAVRTVIRRILLAAGYTVLEAATGREALALSDAHAGPLHLLISDVVMPEMAGRELADEISLRRPECRVLLLSGYTDEALERHGVEASAHAFLQKPFTPNALEIKVREMLAGA
jgi:PAS domain S-box-containing protein